MFSSASIAYYVNNAIILLVAVVVHEFAHAYMAYRMGDNTAKEQGRMTLDPRANVYWPGYLIGVFIGFAVLGSAPVNPYRMRDPRKGTFLAVLAGPVSNLLLAVIFSIPFMLGLMQPALVGGASLQLLPTLPQLFTGMVYLNVLLFVFNILPLAPLDGWTVLYALLPPKAATWWAKHKSTSQIILFVLIGLSFIGGSIYAMLPASLHGWLANLITNPLDFIIGQPSVIIMRFLFGM